MPDVSSLGSITALAIPSPSHGAIDIGPFPLRGYAVCIIIGIIAAVIIGERRWVARGGTFGEVQDLAIWAVPFGLVGGRLYHVITDHDLYFGAGKHPYEALYVWRGGLGIWGAVALGALGVYFGTRGKGIKMAPMLDALAPGMLIAQGLGRWGNWFNQELYGKPTTLPWGLKIDEANWQCAPHNEGVGGECPYTSHTLFQPTFLYEFLWDFSMFGIVLWADRRFKLGHGRVMALYVMAYTLGRGWIETLRVDDVELDNVFGLRLNVWTSIICFAVAAAYFVWATRNRPGREEQVYREGFGPGSDDGGTTVDEADSDSDSDAASDSESDADGEPVTPAGDPLLDDTADPGGGGSTADSVRTGSAPGTTVHDATEADPAP